MKLSKVAGGVFAALFATAASASVEAFIVGVHSDCPGGLTA